MIDDLRIVQTIVDMAVGIPRFTYQMNRNAPRPNGEYAAVRLRRTHNPGYDKVEYLDNPFGGLTMRTKGVRVLEFDILFSRDDTEIDLFNNSFHRPDIHQYLNTKGYALMERTTLNIKDTKFETDWEVRTGVTIKLSTVRTTLTEVQDINTVEINGECNEGSHVYKVGTIKVGDNKE